MFLNEITDDSFDINNCKYFLNCKYSTNYDCALARRVLCQRIWVDVACYKVTAKPYHKTLNWCKNYYYLKAHDFSPDFKSMKWKFVSNKKSNQRFHKHFSNEQLSYTQKRCQLTTSCNRNSNNVLVMIQCVNSYIFWKIM